MRQKASIFAILALCAGFLAAGPVAAAADAQVAQAVLKAKGLARSGATYLLEGELKLPEELRAMRAAKFRVDQNAAQRAKLERAIENTDDVIVQCAKEISEATAGAS